MNFLELFKNVPDVAVSRHMSIEIRDVAKGFVTNAALVGRGRTMSRFVFLQVGFLPESLMAHHTLKWSLAYLKKKSKLSVKKYLHFFSYLNGFFCGR